MSMSGLFLFARSSNSWSIEGAFIDHHIHALVDTVFGNMTLGSFGSQPTIAYKIIIIYIYILYYYIVCLFHKVPDFEIGLCWEACLLHMLAHSKGNAIQHGEKPSYESVYG